MEERKVVMEIKDLCKYFGGVKAIDKINMKLYEGEIIAIVGDNGAGKSTIIKTISGVYKKNSGEIYIGGEKVSINKPTDARMYGIETVYQEQGLIPNFNAAANVFLGREKLQDNTFGKFIRILYTPEIVFIIVDLLKRIGIKLKDINLEIKNLSGGQRQSIVVGKAIYWGGKILIFDEPTNNLGAKQEKKVMNLIKKIRNEYNVSIIIITHNIKHVFELVDRIIVLRNGKKVGDIIKDKTNPNEIVSMITGIAQSYL